jgi:hypothetical protein
MSRVRTLVPRQRVDGHQGDHETAEGGFHLVQQSGEHVGGHRLRQTAGADDDQVSGGVSEDDPLLSQGPEQAAQADSEVTSWGAAPFGDSRLDVAGSDLAQGGHAVGCPAGQDGPEGSEVTADVVVAARLALAPPLAA